MSRIWREPYTKQRAEEINIRCGDEGYLMLCDSGAEWIYYVHVCSFTFAFYSLMMIQEYLDYYTTKILPSRRGTSVWTGEPQPHLNRLPLRLRSEAKRHQVIKALTRAFCELRKQDASPSVPVRNKNAVKGE